MQRIGGVKSSASVSPDSLQAKDVGAVGADGVAAPKIERLGDGRVRVGMVTVDPQKRQISFPAKINQRQGLVEYAVVTSKGKVHESVLVTQVPPMEIHIAALLVNLAPPNGSVEPGKVAVEVEWAAETVVRREPLERLIVHAKDAGEIRAGSVLLREAWHYVGSGLNADSLMDEAECGVISLISDSTALIQNPRVGKLDDELHAPNPSLLLEEGVPVVVHLLPFVEK